MTIDLNTPPHLQAALSEDFPRAPGNTVGEISAALAGLGGPAEAPKIEGGSDTTVELPAGFITAGGLLVTNAQVRELNGYDEERLSRIDMQKNIAVYMTELLMLGVEFLGDGKPSKDTVRGLLIGDRDALMLGIRKATYGKNVEFKLSCISCGKESDVEIDIDTDVPITKLDDPLKRVFDVPLRNGSAKVTLLTGVAQEAFSADITKRTTAEINTAMLAKSVVEINGISTFGQDDPVRRLSSADRATLADFIGEHQPGPSIGLPIQVPCATCGDEYPITLGLPNLFRF